ncbi:AAA family ATPase [Streptomyces sp. HPF1205]|uniref:helix-turn-helix transcriptional regulator n=1 Tax=Streptomyces sp. HPF1205 TaxID=2873262 RepID=UPI001CEDF458|nr:AAA family ATPase [Streptomyces sp. HPF1205]
MSSSRRVPAAAAAVHPPWGRERQWAQVLALLAAAASGSRQGGVLLVEGPPGAGRSRLLTDATAHAARSGFWAVYAAADEVRRAVPLAPLSAALGGGSAHAPPAGEGGTAGPAGPIDARPMDAGPIGTGPIDTGPIDRFRVRLDRRLRSGPVAVVLDDLHWADPLTLAALHSLVTRFAARPVVWILARCQDRGGPTVDRLFAVLREGAGAEYALLEPLPGAAVARLAAERLGAHPSHELLGCLEAADGNPAALVALLDGLAEEDRLRTADGQARLTVPAGRAGTGEPAVSAGRAETGESAVPADRAETGEGAGDAPAPPRRFSTLVRHRTKTFSPAARLLLDVAAVLGRQFRPDDVSHILGETAAATLPALQEALESRIVVATHDTIAFRHELVRQALLATLPRPLRGALHRQAAEMLLGRDGDVLRAAAHLARGARPGDSQAAEVLHAAAGAVRAADPRAAAELALRALEISGPGAAARPRLLRTVVDTLTRVGPLPRAVALAREALNTPLPPDQAADLKCGLSSALLLSGRAAEAAAACDDAESDGRAREEAARNRLYALTALDVPAALHEARRATGPPHGVRAGEPAVLALALWRSGRLGDALRVARTAVDSPQDGSAGPRHIPPRLILAAMLTRMRRTGEAAAAVRLLAADIEADGQAVLRAAPVILGASIALAQGALDAATAKATAGLAEARQAGMPLFSPLGHHVLAEVGLRRGDLTMAEDHVGRLAESAERTYAQGDEARALAAFGAWTAAQLAAARGDRAALDDALRTVHRDPRALRRLLAGEPAAAAWLVRVAIAAGEPERAAPAVRLAVRLAADNADVPTLVAAAAHARGLFERDPAALRHAVEQHQDAWALASAAEDLGSVLAADRDAAVEAFDRAMAGYARLGAERDEARVRRRLRRLGVRRRHWTHADRPPFGWASLTDTERRVAELVAQGLTNRQVAARMFLSPHTVGFHLRQIFRKLRINSRVGLARAHHENDTSLRPDAAPRPARPAPPAV